MNQRIPFSTIKIEFYWNLSGENTSLYNVVSKNNTDVRLVITGEPEGIDKNEDTFDLQINDDHTISQTLLVNNTSMNDRPNIHISSKVNEVYDTSNLIDYKPYKNRYSYNDTTSKITIIVSDPKHIRLDI